jgi:hypothetical protein
MAQTTSFGPISLSLLSFWATQLLLSFDDGLTGRLELRQRGRWHCIEWWWW